MCLGESNCSKNFGSTLPNSYRFLLGCQYGNPSRNVGGICLFYLLFLVFFSVSVKVLPVTPLVSGVFVHRAFCAYFLRIERVVEMRRFLWWTQENH